MLMGYGEKEGSPDAQSKGRLVDWLDNMYDPLWWPRPLSTIDPGSIWDEPDGEPCVWIRELGGWIRRERACALLPLDHIVHRSSRGETVMCGWKV